MTIAVQQAIYSMVDQYTAQYGDEVPADERETLAKYFQDIVNRLMRSESVDAETQQQIAAVYGVEDWRIPDISDFLSQWGRDDDDYDDEE